MTISPVSEYAIVACGLVGLALLTYGVWMLFQ